MTTAKRQRMESALWRKERDAANFKKRGQEIPFSLKMELRSLACKLSNGGKK